MSATSPAAVLGTQQPRRRRRRARGRSADGAIYPTIINADPDCKYKLVFNGSGGEAIGEHEEDGWQTVLYTKDGPRLSVGKTCRPNEPIEWKGHTLMDIHKDDWEDIQNEGQAAQDKIEALILDKNDGPIDPGRGIHGKNGIRIVKTATEQRTLSAPIMKDEDDDG